MGDFCGKAFVVHQEEIEFPDVIDQEFLQAVRQKMACLNQIVKDI
jgi:hypothetical protein